MGKTVLVHAWRCEIRELSHTLKQHIALSDIYNDRGQIQVDPGYWWLTMWWLISIVNLKKTLESPRKGVSRRCSLHWVSLWSCLWACLKFVDMGRLSSLFPRQTILNCVRVKIWTWAQANIRHLCLTRSWLWAWRG